MWDHSTQFGCQKQSAVIWWGSIPPDRLLTLATKSVEQRIPVVIMGARVVASCLYPDDRLWSDRYGYTHPTALDALQSVPGQELPPLPEPASLIRASMILAVDRVVWGYSFRPTRPATDAEVREHARIYLEEKIAHQSPGWWLARSSTDWGEAAEFSILSRAIGLSLKARSRVA